MDSRVEYNEETAPTDIFSMEENGKLQMEFLQLMGLKEQSTILDIGCGPLHLGRALVPFLDEGHYTGIDISGKALEAGRLALGNLLEARLQLEHIRFRRLNWQSQGKAEILQQLVHRAPGTKKLEHPLRLTTNTDAFGLLDISIPGRHFVVLDQNGDRVGAFELPTHPVRGRKESLKS